MKPWLHHIVLHFGAIPFTEPYLKACVECLRRDFAMTKREIHTFLRLLVTGQESGPEFYAMLVIMGRERVMARLEGWNRVVQHGTPQTLATIFTSSHDFG